ncbi:hypothetical protein QFC20_000498 [Naganishia adeliensis]|uniref:Uncharacterized protein n=1 Tax=Naganishia adeliensis TaxID=92952 RepID=A0ACC2WZI5_9TREE|nr:hypothetical protein QFC20_000498 [Naganishia adeliensis]
MSIVKTVALGTKQVPALCLGTWAWGDKHVWDYQEARDYENLKETWKACEGLGLSFYDTAEIYGYGESERIIGKLLKDSSEEYRKKVVIATKYLPFPHPGNWFFFRPAIVTACRKSLERLGVDQIHGATSLPFHSWEAQGAQLAECVKLGLAKQVGVSNFNKEELINMYDILQKHGLQLASNQVEYSLLRTLPEDSGLFAAMKERGIALLAYSPLGQGRLTGKYSAANPPPSGRRFSNMPMEQLEPLLDAMRGIAAKYDVPVSAVALNWVIAKGAIPLGGAKNRQQAEQNAKALTFTLTDEEVEELASKSFKGKTSFWQHG